MPYHASSDTLDKVDSRELKLNAAIARVLTWNLANSNTPLPPRQSAEEVVQLLKLTGVAKEMRNYNIWADFFTAQTLTPIITSITVIMSVFEIICL